MCQYGTLTHSSPFRVGRTVPDFPQCFAIEFHAIIALHTVSNTRRPPQSALLLTSFKKLIAGIDRDSALRRQIRSGNPELGPELGHH